MEWWRGAQEGSRGRERKGRNKLTVTEHLCPVLETFHTCLGYTVCGRAGIWTQGCLTPKLPHLYYTILPTKIQIHKEGLFLTSLVEGLEFYLETVVQPFSGSGCECFTSAWNRHMGSVCADLKWMFRKPSSDPEGSLSSESISCLSSRTGVVKIL